MSKPKYLEVREGYAWLSPTGEFAIPELARAIGETVQFCREHGHTRLLVNLTQVSNLRLPSVADRYFFVKDWAEKSMGRVALAIVAKPEHIDPQKFSSTVAENNGLRFGVFSSEAAALEWHNVR